MRSLAKYLFVFLLVAYPHLAEAQVAEPQGLRISPPRRSILSNQAQVLQAQFEDLLDPVLPDVEREAAPGDAMERAGGEEPTDGDNQPAAEQQPTNTPTTPEPLPAGNGADNRSVLDPGELEFNQTPYLDMPISDVIQEDATEIFSTNNWFRGGHWYSKQEFIMLLRTEISLVHVAVDATEGVASARLIPSPFSNSALNTKDAGFTYEAGTRLSLGRILGRDVANRDHGIEFSFLGLFDYTGRSSLVPNDPTFGGITSLLSSPEVTAVVDGVLGGIPVINRVVGFDNSLFQEIAYEADLNSMELNYTIGARPMRDRLVMQPDGRWVRHATPSIVRGLFTGIRYIRQNERFTYTGQGGRNRFQDQTGQITFLNTVDAGGTYRVTTDNDMIGIQLGGEVIRKRTDWTLGLSGRIGGLINFADRNSQLEQTFDNDLTGGVNLTTERSSQVLNDETLTFLGEANAYVAYYLRPNTSVRMGYSLLFMNGVATAVDNIGLGGGFPKFEVTGNALYHGMTLGMEMTW